MAVLTSGLGLSRTKLVKDIASLSVKHKTAYMCAESLQLCPALCDPVDCSLPGSAVHGIFQARILERVAMPFSRESSTPGIKSMSLMSTCTVKQVVYH